MRVRVCARGAAVTLNVVEECSLTIFPERSYIVLLIGSLLLRERERESGGECIYVRTDYYFLSLFSHTYGMVRFAAASRVAPLLAHAQGWIGNTDTSA